MYGVPPSLARALPYYRTLHGRIGRLGSIVFNAIETHRNRPTSHSPNDASNVQMSTIYQGGGAGV